MFLIGEVRTSCERSVGVGGGLGMQPPLKVSGSLMKWPAQQAGPSGMETQVPTHRSPFPSSLAQEQGSTKGASG